MQLDALAELADFGLFVAQDVAGFDGFGGFGGGPGAIGGGDGTDRNSWVTSTCKLVSYGGSATLYDCAGAAK